MCTAEFLEDIQLLYTLYCKFSRSPQFYRSLSHNISTFFLALLREVLHFYKIVLLNYTLYCRIRSVYPVFLSNSFQMFQWYRDRTPSRTAHMKPRRSGFTLFFNLTYFSLVPKCLKYASIISFFNFGVVQNSYRFDPIPHCFAPVWTGVTLFPLVHILFYNT